MRRICHPKTESIVGDSLAIMENIAYRQLFREIEYRIRRLQEETPLLFYGYRRK